MSPELQHILTTITKFANKTEAKEWFKDNQTEIIPLLTDLFEQEPSQYNSVVEDLVENFVGATTTIKDAIKRGVGKLLADRRDERASHHWIDPNEPPMFTPDAKGKILPTQRLLVEILHKSKYVNVVLEEHRKSNDLEVYGEYRLPWITTESNSLRIQYQIEHRIKKVREVIYYPVELKYQQSSLKYYLGNFFTTEVDWRALRDAINVVALENKVNVVQDYFTNGIEEWDGKDRMDLLFRLAGAKNERWARIVLRLIMLSIMARTFEPGYDFRGSALLVGPENIGKSWFTSKLSIHQRFFLQFTFERNTNNAEIGRLFEGRMVIELADTGGMGIRNDNQIKAFLTQKADNFRRMRSDIVEDMDRSCIFIITANSMEYYLGHIGNTRIWPIEVDKFDMEAIELELPQLFAQAKYMWDHGETPRPTDEELELQQQMVLQQEVKPNWFYLLLTKLKLEQWSKYFEADNNSYSEGMTMAEMLHWFEDETWYTNNKLGQYRKEIAEVLKKYFHIKQTYKNVPVMKRKIADKPETIYKFRYVGNVDWNEFIVALED